MSKFKRTETTGDASCPRGWGDGYSEPSPSTARAFGPPKQRTKPKHLSEEGGCFQTSRGRALQSMRPRTPPRRRPPPPPRRRETAQGSKRHARRPPGPAPPERRSRGGGNLKAPAQTAAPRSAIGTPYPAASGQTSSRRRRGMVEGTGCWGRIPRLGPKQLAKVSLPGAEGEGRRQAARAAPGAGP